MLTIVTYFTQLVDKIIEQVEQGIGIFRSEKKTASREDKGMKAG